MSNIKVLGGTPNHSRNLCHSCRWSQVTKGQRLSEEIVICSNSRPFQVTFAVTSCSSYDEKSNASLWEMEKVAWKFAAGKDTKKVGFMTPEQYRRENGTD